MLFPYRMQHVYDDEGVCYAEGYIMRHQEQETEITDVLPFVSIRPNPASDFATISFSIQMDRETIFELYDMLGNLVKTATIPANTQEYDFSLNGISNGAYLYIWENNTRGKLIIIR